jgi:hypothetical protein
MNRPRGKRTGDAIERRFHSLTDALDLGKDPMAGHADTNGRLAPRSLVSFAGATALVGYGRGRIASLNGHNTRLNPE